MTHPEDLLAGYVDGTLTEKERAVVDAHLLTCEVCREEIPLASRARFLLTELPEVDVPFGVDRPVMAEIADQVRRPRPSPWRARLSWAFAAAGAATIVVLVATNGQRLIEGGGGGGVPAAAPTAAFDRVAGGAEAAALAPLEVQPDVNYDTSKVAQLASQVAGEASREALKEPTTSASAQEAGAALDCLLQGSGLSPTDPNERIVRLIDARYDGTPAYLGVFLESPGAGQPPNKVIVWVISKTDCSRILDFAYQRII